MNNMKNRIALVKPEMLIWARKYASNNPDNWRETATYLNRILSPRTLAEIEAGASITVDELRKIANAYEIPLAMFYRPKPPGETINVLEITHSPDLPRAYISELIELKEIIETFIGEDGTWEGSFDPETTIITIKVVEMRLDKFLSLEPLDYVL